MTDPVTFLSALQAVLDHGLRDLTPPQQVELLNQAQRLLAQANPIKHPVANVQWHPIGSIQANDYNPNSVAQNEMRLLHTSISHDGYTQPIVTIYDDAANRHVIVDGFHRYATARENQDIRDSTLGHLPIVALDKTINDRMASTVRHNRARGKHAITGMANMVFAMLDGGWPDDRICAELGMEPDELLRLKHVTGFSKLFENVEYRRAWQTKRQLKVARKHREETNA